MRRSGVVHTHGKDAHGEQPTHDSAPGRQRHARAQGRIINPWCEYRAAADCRGSAGEGETGSRQDFENVVDEKKRKCVTRRGGRCEVGEAHGAWRARSRSLTPPVGQALPHLTPPEPRQGSKPAASLPRVQGHQTPAPPPPPPPQTRHDGSEHRTHTRSTQRTHRAWSVCEGDALGRGPWALGGLGLPLHRRQYVVQAEDALPPGVRRRARRAGGREGRRGAWRRRAAAGAQGKGGRRRRREPGLACDTGRGQRAGHVGAAGAAHARSGVGEWVWVWVWRADVDGKH